MDSGFMDEPWGEYEEGIPEGSWVVEYEEELPIGHPQEPHANESDNEWIEIVETEEGLDTEPRKAPSPYDDLEEPIWSHEEQDQKRVDDAKNIVEEHLNPYEQWSQQEITPDLQAKKKELKKDDDDKTNVEANLSPSNAATSTSLPTPPAIQIQQKPPPPPPQQPPPPPPQPPPPFFPPPRQPPAPPAPPPPPPPAPPAQPKTSAPPPQRQTAPVSIASPTAVSIAKPSHAGPITLPIASPVRPPALSTNTPTLGHTQDLGALGQIGVFSNDGFSLSNQRMDSFAILLAFIFIVFYTRTLYN